MSNKAEQQQITNNITDTSLEQIEDEKKYSKLQWFFFVIVIPLLFAIAIALVVMTIAGINVFDLAHKYGEKLPVISSIIADDEKVNETTENVFTLKATIEDQKVEIAKLQADIENKENERKISQEEIENLQKQLEALQAQEKEATIKLEELAKMYETMSAKKSAAIFSEMANQDALDILVKMNNESRAAVLEKMDPKKAAALTVLLKAEEDKVNAEINNEQRETTANDN